ncbi:hypothetical protein NT6N_32880 [Oceaniferula spumae]|uniref:ABC transmembrane type-1 domain-containing protein n=1 Tax=Oceaniferula spumae TaxID=2979115 RepID=A0AAT9FQM8_9BACT
MKLSSSRRLKNRIATTLFSACALSGVVLFAVLFFAVVGKGIGALSFDFLSKGMEQAGASGGILMNLLGTAILLVTAAIVAVPISTALAFLVRYFRKRDKLSGALEMLLYILNGVPSILLGIMGFILFVRDLEMGKSWLTGGVLLGMMIVPTITVVLIERISAIPSAYIESARGLGMNKAQVAWTVVLPRCWSSILTGLLLGLARAAGETAPILFTATVFSGAGLPEGIKNSPVLTLPYHIFVLAQDSLESASGNLWGAALVLLLLVFAMSMLVLPIRLKTHDESRHA